MYINLGSEPQDYKDAMLYQTIRPPPHLIMKERQKLMRQGMTDSINLNSYTGDEMIGLLHTSGQLLVPAAISPLGNLGPLLRRLLYGTTPSTPYNFPTT